MNEEKKKRAYRVCPCSPYDVEGLQSWLEELALEGLFLEKDGVFCGVFSFEKAAPRKAAYRLDVEQRQGGIFGSYDTPTEEETELYRELGWEYLARYAAFRIYCSFEQMPRELNTDPAVHAMTIGILKKQQRSALLLGIFHMVFFCVLYSAGPLSYVFRIAATLGVAFTLSLYGSLLYAVLRTLARLLRLRRYEKRLRRGESLTRKRDWRKRAATNYILRALPFVMSVGIIAGLFSALPRVSEKTPISNFTDETPFAAILDMFPGGTVTDTNDMLDYNTAVCWSNAAAESWEWNESCYVTDAEGNRYFCILRLEYYEAACEWIAAGIERDAYRYDANRYHGKRFEELDAPDLEVDSVRVYSSYGSLYILMREGNRVVHAVVLIDSGEQQNDWILWAQAMAEKIK